MDENNAESSRIAEGNSTSAALESSSASEVMVPKDWKLSPSEAIIFLGLLREEAVSKPTLLDLLQRRRSTAKAKSLDVFMHHLRRKTKAAGVVIETVYGAGYRLMHRESWLNTLAA